MTAYKIKYFQNQMFIIFCRPIWFGCYFINTKDSQYSTLNIGMIQCKRHAGNDIQTSRDNIRQISNANNDAAAGMLAANTIVTANTCANIITRIVFSIAALG